MVRAAPTCLVHMFKWHKRLLQSFSDAITEGSLLQTSAVNFLASAKMIVLLASAIKAARVGARRKRVRRLRAQRIIARAVRVRIARARVANLRQKHEAAAKAIQALHTLRQAHNMDNDLGNAVWSSVSLPEQLNDLHALLDEVSADEQNNQL